MNKTTNMMRIVLPALVLVAVFGRLSAQITSENMDCFYNDINQLILSTEKKTGKEIVFDIYGYIKPEDPKGAHESVSFTFMNDSVFRQSFGRRRVYYFVIRGEETFGYDYKKRKVKEPRLRPNETERDSAGYRLRYWEEWNKSPNPDTVRYFYRARKDTGVWEWEMLRISAKEPSRLSRYFYFGDTLSIYRDYISGDSGWVIRSEHTWYIGRVDSSYTVERYVSAWYDKRGKEPGRNSTCTETRYYYDERKRLSRVESFRYENGSESWAEKNVMTISYYRKM